MKPLKLLLLLALTECSAASDPYAPRAGLWEVRTSFVTISGPGVSKDRIAELRRAFAKPIVEQQCFDGRVAHVGDPKMEGRCKVTRVSDAGAVADTEWQCDAASKHEGVTSTVHGSRGPERYDYRIATASVAPGGAETVVTMREQGRRLGDCPAR